MKPPKLALDIPGREAIVEWFGEWPSFHDAEIVALSLPRSGKSVLQVYPYYPAKPGTVNFILEEVTDLKLADFSTQNVIGSLDLEHVIDQTECEAIRVRFSPLFGLGGWIDAKRLRLEILPGKSPDGISQW